MKERKHTGSGKKVKNGENKGVPGRNLSISPEDGRSEVLPADDAIPMIYDEEAERGEF